MYSYTVKGASDCKNFEKDWSVVYGHLEMKKTFWLSLQNVAVPGSRSTVQITTKQLIELFFSSQALLHCKSIPTLEYGFLVQVIFFSLED